MSNLKHKNTKEIKWFQSSFDFSSSLSPKKRRKVENQKTDSFRESTQKGSDYVEDSKTKNYNWLEKYRPFDVTELAVNNKKIQEVEDWLNSSLSTPGQNSILLLSGPSGCGKTETIQLLAKKLGCNISEWVTPLDVDLVRDLGSNSYSYHEKQTDRFLDFLLKASRFRSLLSGNQSNRIVLVEDYPNIFTKEPSEFHNVLQNFENRGKSPLIFICTDSNDGRQSMLWNLFPPNIIEKFHINHICFNPIAATALKQALKRIIGLASKSDNSVKIPDQECIDMIINSSMGDIRSAVNNLCLTSLKGAGPLHTLTKTVVKQQQARGKDKKSKEKSQSKFTSLGRNESISIMHGVGRVLNPKFAEKIKANDIQKFTHSPEDIAELFEVQPISFVGYIHENYLPHFASITDVEIAANNLSDADCFLSEWRERAGKVYGLTVAIAGLMIANKTPVSSWHPVRGPKKAAISYPTTKDIPLLEPNQMICGKVLVTDYKGFCEIISEGGAPQAEEDLSLIEEYTISE